METLRNVVAGQPLLFVLGVMMAIDVVSGICAAAIERKLSSKVSFAGMMRKTHVALLVGMAAVLERVQPDVPLIKLVCTFFTLTEALSILENAKRAGVPIPRVLSNAIDQMHTAALAREKKPDDGAR